MVNLLHEKLKYDLSTRGIPTDFTLVIKKFSSTYEGRYNPNTEEVTIYNYEDKECTKLKPYHLLLDTLIHEAIHHYQWKHDINFKRYKGVMHNSDFKYLYSKWSNKPGVEVI